MSPQQYSPRGQNIPFFLKTKMKYGSAAQAVTAIIVLLVLIGPFIQMHIGWVAGSISGDNPITQESMSESSAQDSHYSWETSITAFPIKFGDQDTTEIEYDDDIGAVFYRTRIILGIGMVLTLVAAILTILASKGYVFVNNAMILAIVGGIVLIISPIYFLFGIAGASEMSVGEVFYYSDSAYGFTVTSHVTLGWYLPLVFGVLSIIFSVKMRDATKTTRPKKDRTAKQGSTTNFDITSLVRGVNSPPQPPPGFSQTPQPLHSPQPLQPQIQQPLQPQYQPQQSSPPQFQQQQPSQPNFQPQQYPPQPQFQQPQQQRPQFPLQQPTPPQFQQPQQQRPQIPLQQQQTSGQNAGMGQPHAPQPNRQTPQGALQGPPSPGSWTCPNCAVPIDANYQFCLRCGHQKTA